MPMPTGSWRSVNAGGQMAESTNIEWTDATWQPITGCSLVDEGCRNCYAARLAATRLKHHPSRTGLARLNADGVAKFTGEVRLNEQWLYQPLRWKRPRKIFVCAHGDLFHENVPTRWIDRVFNIMAECPQHTFQVLTKRPAVAAHYLCAQRCEDVGLPNVWIGTSISDQKSADERLPILCEIPAAIRFVSAEPLLGPVNLAGYSIDWVIAGGESGPHARPAHPDWFRGLRDQCLETGTAFLVKQLGAWVSHLDRDKDDPDWRADYSRFRRDPRMRVLNFAGGWGFHGEHVHIMRRVGKKAAGRILDGREWNQFPNQNMESA